MKKIYLSIVLFSLLLNSCSMDGYSVSERHIKDLENRIAKLEANVLTIQFNDGKVVETKPVEKVVKEKTEEKVDEKEEIKAIVPEPKVFEISEPSEGANLTKEPITFVGIIDKRATKISVKYIGVDSTDDYTLKNFKEGDTSFWYKASGAFGNLSKGKNTYEFIAEFSDGDKVALEPIVINYK
jgi:hypothetical protein